MGNRGERKAEFPLPFSLPAPFLYRKIPLINPGLIQLRERFLAIKQKLLSVINKRCSSLFGAIFRKELPLRNCGVHIYIYMYRRGTTGICFVTKLMDL